MTRLIAFLFLAFAAAPASASSPETLEAAARVFSLLGRGPVHHQMHLIQPVTTKDGRGAAQFSGKWQVIESLKPCVFGVIDGSDPKNGIDGKYRVLYTLDFSKMTRWYETYLDAPFVAGAAFGERLEFVSVAPDALLYGEESKPIVFNYLSRSDEIVLLSALDRVQAECPFAEAPIN